MYTQQKYNLMREESEGYAKVVTLLNGSNGALNRDNVDSHIANLQVID